MTVEAFLAAHTSRQLSELHALEEVAGPVGPERLDRLAMAVMATIVNAAPGRRGKGIDLAALVPWLCGGDGIADDASLFAKAKAIIGAAARSKSNGNRR